MEHVNFKKSIYLTPKTWDELFYLMNLYKENASRIVGRAISELHIKELNNIEKATQK